MRIPVFKSDLDEGRFTKVAKALRKFWPDGRLRLMPAQNLLAGCMGYRDLHDLQACACDTFSAELTKNLSRSAFIDGMAWRLFRRHNLPLSAARSMVERLPLRELAIDAYTSEAETERVMAQYSSPNLLLLIDEAPQLMQPPYWHDLTPRLLEADVPAFQTVVLPDRQAFRWSVLNHLLRHLPDEYSADLNEDPRYAHLAPGDREIAFITTELVPEAYTPLNKVVEEDRLLPDGFEIVWLFSPEGAPLGRVLRNRVLGGIVPRVFGDDDDGIFQAAAAILCGDVVDGPVLPNATGQPRSYRHRWGYGTKLKDVLSSYSTQGSATCAALSDIAPLDGAVQVAQVDGAAVLCGTVFTEQGQVYVRDQAPWLWHDDVPNCLRKFLRIGTPADDVQPQIGVDVIPGPNAYFFHVVEQATNTAIEKAVANAKANIEGLTAIVLSLASAAEFSAYAARLVDKVLSDEEPEDAGERDDSYREERAREKEEELEDLKWRGRAIKEAIPALAGFDPAGLGLVLVRAHNEYVGSDTAPMPPAADDPSDLAIFLAGLVATAAQCRHGHEAVDLHADPVSLIWAVDLFLVGSISPQYLPNAVQEIRQFRIRLNNQAGDIKAILEWRARDEALRSLRVQGRYLYVKDVVSPTRPKGLGDALAEWMRMGRKYSKAGPVVEVQQTFEMLSEPPRQGCQGDNNGPEMLPRLIDLLARSGGAG